MKKFFSEMTRGQVILIAVLVGIVLAGAAMMIDHEWSAPTPIIVLNSAGDPVEYYVGAHNPLLWPAREEFHMLRFTYAVEAENLRWVFKHRDDAIRITMQGEAFEARYGRLAEIGGRMNGLFTEAMLLREMGLPEDDPEVQERVEEYLCGWEEYWRVAQTLGRPPVTAAYRGI